MIVKTVELHKYFSSLLTSCYSFIKFNIFNFVFFSLLCCFPFFIFFSSSSRGWGVWGGCNLSAGVCIFDCNNNDDKKFLYLVVV